MRRESICAASTLLAISGYFCCILAPCGYIWEIRAIASPHFHQRWDPAFLDAQRLLRAMAARSAQMGGPLKLAAP